MGTIEFLQDKLLIDQCVSAYLSHTPIIYILTDEMHFMDTLIEEQCMVELKRWRGENPDTAVTESVPDSLIRQYAASKEETIKEPGGKYSWKCNMRVYQAGTVIDPLDFIRKREEKFPAILGVKNYKLALNALGIEGRQRTEGNIQRYVMQYLNSSVQSALRRSVLLLADSELIIPKGLEDYVAVIEPESLKASEIKEIIRKFAEEIGESPERRYIEELADRLKGFGREKIRTILTRIIYEGDYLANNQYTALRPPEKRPERVAFDIINQEKQQMLSKEGILDYETVVQDPEIGGMDELMNYLEEKCHFILNHRMEFKRSRNIDFPKGLLVCGIPGTGKSMMARKISKVLNLPLISMDMGNITKSYLGESASNMKKALKLAESMAPCVLWIDEIEKAFAGMNGGASDSASAEVQRCFGMMLKWMQEQGEPKRKGEDPPAPCFLFATSNNVSNLPPEFLRSGRFDKKYYVFMPTEKECIDIFKADIRNVDRACDEKGNRIVLFGKTMQDDGFWKEIMDYCVSDDGKGKRRKFLTGSDIHEINQDAIRRTLYAEFGGNTEKYRKMSAQERYRTLETNFAGSAALAKPYDPGIYKEMLKQAIDEARPYGETNGGDIARCYISLYENRFNPVSREEEVLIPFSEYHSDREEVIDISEERLICLHGDSRYDRELYRYIGERINQIVKER